MDRTIILNILDQFPDDVNVDELIYRLYVGEKIERSEAAIARGEVVSHDEVVRQSRQWFQPQAE